MASGRLYLIVTLIGQTIGHLTGCGTVSVPVPGFASPGNVPRHQTGPVDFGIGFGHSDDRFDLHGLCGHFRGSCHGL